ncbi:MAG: PhoH family protein, partial [Deltaproteobacteria bacterium]|nr:PhoH family protein [Deltaproteobacteria bacterium]
MSNKLDLYLSATQSAYAHSDALINVIIGPAGEGKTYASVGAMIISAQRNKRPVLWAIIRDTHTNIKRSTVRSINKIFRKTPSLASWRDDYRQLTIHCNPKVEVDLFGIDDPGALNRLQGTEYDGIWLEEPAAMLERANSGLSE